MERKWIECIVIIAMGLILIGSGDTVGNNEICLEAHRGWSEYYPENTLVAFEAAGQCEAFDAIETDVQMTKDGVLVLMHDKSLDRTTDGTGEISEYTYEELCALTLDGGNNIENYPQEKIPTLDAYLDICRKYDKTPYIELKTLSKQGIQTLIETLNKEGWNGKCVLTTFSLKNLKKVRQITDDYTIQYMVKDKVDMQEVIQELEGYENIAFRPSAYHVTYEIVAICKEKGWEVECYGLKSGDRETYKRLKELGIAGVTCNDWNGLE